MPPVTITQLANVFGYGLKRDYVSWKEISPNVKLAAIASEDQSFPDHGGFDWDAIQKSPTQRKKIRRHGFRWVVAPVPLRSRLPKMFFYGREEGSQNLYARFPNYI
ncbi:MAG: monofunctional biosynthetic peptidoglycan transglycosylase, partial [Sediminibacterium sp.]|nr:monofunctional biosynthetic peptidoglycan transglycosylase [Sediminibacterium sp.]